jgi:transcriptional regulator with XRE-family HTH domain
MMTLGKRICLARQRKGLSQAQLAEKCDLTPVAISRYELDISEPTLFNATTLSLVLGVSLDWLVGRTEEQ